MKKLIIALTLIVAPLYSDIYEVFNVNPLWKHLPGELQAEISRKIPIVDQRFVPTAQTLSGHAGLVFSVAWSPDGKQLASANGDTTIKIWDVSTGQVVQTLSGHADVVLSVAWSPDGKWLASGGDDTTIKIWDISTGHVVQTLSGHADVVKSVAWSPDGKQLASGSYDQTIKIWDISTGQVVQTLSGHAGWVESVAWSPDGKQLASGSGDKTIKIWDVSTGHVVQTLSGHAGGVLLVAWSPDGKQLVSGSYDKTIKIWDVSTGHVVQTLSGHAGWVKSVAWSPDGEQLASGSYDNTIKIWTEKPFVAEEERRWFSLPQVLFLKLLYAKRPTLAHAKKKPLDLADLHPKVSRQEASVLLYSFKPETQQKLKQRFNLQNMLPKEVLVAQRVAQRKIDKEDKLREQRALLRVQAAAAAAKDDVEDTGSDVEDLYTLELL